MHNVIGDETVIEVFDLMAGVKKRVHVEPILTRQGSRCGVTIPEFHWPSPALEFYNRK